MRLEVLCYAFNSRDRPTPEIIPTESFLDLLTDTDPLCLADFGMDASVGHDLHCTVG
jgi:hypothetical protein